MKFTSIFNHKHQREKESKEIEKLAAAHEMGVQMSKTVVSLIDSYRVERLIPAAGILFKHHRNELLKLHKSENLDGVINEGVAFQDRCEQYKQRAVADLWSTSGGWDVTLIEMGEKQIFDEYIKKTFDPIWEYLKVLSLEDQSYALARISGNVTDEMDRDFEARGQPR